MTKLNTIYVYHPSTLAEQDEAFLQAFNRAFFSCCMKHGDLYHHFYDKLDRKEISQVMDEGVYTLWRLALFITCKLAFKSLPPEQVKSLFLAELQSIHQANAKKNNELWEKFLPQAEARAEELNVPLEEISLELISIPSELHAFKDLIAAALGKDILLDESAGSEGSESAPPKKSH